MVGGERGGETTTAIGCGRHGATNLQRWCNIKPTAAGVGFGAPTRSAPGRVDIQHPVSPLTLLSLHAVSTSLFPLGRGHHQCCPTTRSFLPSGGSSEAPRESVRARPSPTITTSLSHHYTTATTTTITHTDRHTQSTPPYCSVVGAGARLSCCSGGGGATRRVSHLFQLDSSTPHVEIVESIYC